MSEQDQNNTTTIVDAGRTALDRIRWALIEVYNAIGADAAKPQDVSRRFGLNRNLTWKLSRVITADDAFSALNHLPGNQGIELALAKFSQAGASDQLIQNVRDSVRQFMEVITTHAGDRDQFELTLESMGLFEREYRIDTARELAFRGNSMIWGVQVATRIATAIAIPTTTDQCAYLQLTGLVGFRTLRPGINWRLFRRSVFGDKGDGQIATPKPIFPVEPGDTPTIIREFCSPRVPNITVVDAPDGQDFILEGGAVGNQGSFDAFFGYRADGLTRYRTDENQFGASACSISVPAEYLISDLIVHKDMAPATPPKCIVYGVPHGGMEAPSAQTPRNEINCPCPIKQLPDSLTALATPRIPHYHKFLARIFEHIGCSVSDFVMYRVQLQYPVMPSRILLRMDLPERP